MYSVDLEHRTLVCDQRSFTEEQEYQLNNDIFSIEKMLLCICRKEGWISSDGFLVVTNGYELLGSNIITSYLSNLFCYDEYLGKMRLNHEIAKRFTPNGVDDNPKATFLEIERLLRLRFGDYILERYINRLLYSYFTAEEIEADCVDNVEPGLSEFTKGWWVLFALQNTMLSYEVDKIMTS